MTCLRLINVVNNPGTQITGLLATVSLISIEITSVCSSLTQPWVAWEMGIQESYSPSAGLIILAFEGHGFLCVCTLSLRSLRQALLPGLEMVLDIN